VPWSTARPLRSVGSEFGYRSSRSNGRGLELTREQQVLGRAR